MRSGRVEDYGATFACYPTMQERLAGNLSRVFSVMVMFFRKGRLGRVVEQRVGWFRVVFI